MPQSERVDPAEADTPFVNVRTVSDDRRVFTEEDNPDGWIATDLTVPLEE